MNIEHISVSRRNVYGECPQRYKYQYHLKLPSTEPEPFYFIYGKIVHRIAEEYVREEGAQSIQDITDLIFSGDMKLEDDREGNPVFAPRTLPKEYKKKFPGHMRAIQNLTDQIGFGGHLEYEFRYDLDPPNEKFIKGFIDRIIIRDGNYFILDYKTTKKGRFRKTRVNIIDDIQLRIYAKVVQKEFDVPANKIKAALHYVEGNDLIGASFSQKSLDEAEKTMLDAYNQISMADPDKVQGYVGDYCRRCDYRKICPFYSLT